MSTAENKPDEQAASQTPSSTGKSRKKPKSAGFIESTNFKPSWLETGPLSPDMLPPELAEKSTPDSTQMESASDELLAQLAELERLYGESEPAADEVQEAAEIVTDEPLLEAEAPAAEVPATDEAQVEPEMAPEPEPEQEPPIAEPAAPHPDEIPEDVARLIEDILIEPEPESVATPDVDTEVPAPELVAAAAIVSEAEDIAESAELLTETAPVPAAEPAPLPPVPAKAPTRQKQSKPARKHPLFDGLARTLLITGLTLFGLAALTYFVNPFARVALATAELARPVASPAVAAPTGAGAAWCVSGSFLGSGDAPLRMQDTGQQGDIVAGDSVFALQMDSLAPGAYQWQVVGCEQGELVYPAAGTNSWVQVSEPGQEVTFLFDSAEREDALFFPIPFVVSAFDDTVDYRVMGSFQDWNPDDRSARLQHLGGGMYQQVRRIARPGNYEAYVIAGTPEQAIDAYGRTNEPIPFSFETNRRGDAVVFLLDTNRGRASVLYGMPWIATELAYGVGFRALSLLLGLVGLVLLGWMLLRMIMMGNDANWLEAGCPQCRQHELMRISRRSLDRLLNGLGIPAYRYQCRHCTWTGIRLSEEGAPVSPGVTTSSTLAETAR